LSRIVRLVSLWAPVLAYGGLVYYLSSLPQAVVAGSYPDYLVHSLEYLGLTLLVIRALNQGFVNPIPDWVRLSAPGITVIYAVLDEIHQMSVPRRTASVKDVFSDALGAVLAIGVAELIHRFRTRQRRNQLNVVLYTRRDCHLCSEARAVLEGVGVRIPLKLMEVDVDKVPELEERYGAEVPVIVADGTKVSKLTPNREAIERRLLRMAAHRR
jgi:VanZ family protein/glutaredoxin